MTRDLLLSDKVNITSFYNLKNSEIKITAKAQDFYMYAGELIQKELDNDENINLNNIKMTRELIKKTVMTIPYNISLTGIGEQFMELFD